MTCALAVIKTKLNFKHIILDKQHKIVFTYSVYQVFGITTGTDQLVFSSIVTKQAHIVWSLQVFGVVARD